MKKIFAIALALVMVLSMASAFAAVGTCGAAWTYPCTSYSVNCGVAKAEVVKYVRTNDCDPYAVSDCAAVIKGLPVYYAVKVTFDEDVNEQWFEHENTKLVVTVKGLKNATTVDAKLSAFGLDYDDVEDGGVFWLAKDPNGGTKLIKDDDFDSKDCVFSGTATSTNVKVCANVAYKFDGLGMDIDYGRYTVRVAATEDGEAVDYIKVVDNSNGKEAYFAVASDKLIWINTGDLAAGEVYVALENGKFIGGKYTENGAEYTEAGEACSYLSDMMKFLQINFRDCVTLKGIEGNFGWDDDDEFEFCAVYGAAASAVVDSECVVAIPKTGDASVLAWLF